MSGVRFLLEVGEGGHGRRGDVATRRGGRPKVDKITIVPRLSVSPRRRVAASASSADEDLPGQMHLFPPIAGDVLEFGVRVEIPRATDPRLRERIQRAGTRLRRGGIAGEAKLRAICPHLEAIAGLFDGR